MTSTLATQPVQLPDQQCLNLTSLQSLGGVLEVFPVLVLVSADAGITPDLTDVPALGVRPLPQVGFLALKAVLGVIVDAEARVYVYESAHDVLYASRGSDTNMDDHYASVSLHHDYGKI
jgi:hypothetical protein